MQLKPIRFSIDRFILLKKKSETQPSELIAPKFGVVTLVAALVVIGGIAKLTIENWNQELSTIYSPYADLKELVPLLLPTFLVTGVIYGFALWLMWVISSWRQFTNTDSSIVAVVQIVMKWMLYGITVVALATLLAGSNWSNLSNWSSQIPRYLATLWSLCIARSTVFYFANARSWATKSKTRKNRQISIGDLAGLTAVTAVMIATIQSYPHPLGARYYMVQGMIAIVLGLNVWFVARGLQSPRLLQCFGWLFAAITICFSSSTALAVVEMFAISGAQQNGNSNLWDPIVWTYNLPLIAAILSGCLGTFGLFCVTGRIDRLRYQRWLEHNGVVTADEPSA